MRARRIATATVAAGFLALAAASPASANLAWCVYDPPVQVESPQGQNLTVNTFVYFAPSARHVAWKVTSDATVEAGAPGWTTIIVNVYVPAGAGPVHVVAVNQRYKITEAQDGFGGDVMTFTLDVPTD